MAHGQQHLFQRFADFGTGRIPANETLHKGRYHVQQTIGKGGMGAVYLALDIQQTKRVAIKEMSQGHLKDASELQRAQQRFQQEADLLRRLQNPHLPKVYDSFQDRDRSYLVMDYIPGQTLFQILKQAHGAALSVKQVLDYGLQLCDVLAYLHKHYPPVIFRDLKPSNIIVQSDGQLFLIDFGIARFWQQDRDAEAFVTQGYTSPEQYSGKSTPQSDIFSLGATLHHCLTGHNPQSNTQAQQWNFLPVDFFNTQAPPKLCALVEQMVQFKAEERPANTDEVQRRLQEIHIAQENALRLANGDTYDPYALTYEMGTPSQTQKSKRGPRSRARLPLARLSWVGNSLFGGLALAFQGVSSASLGSSLLAFPAQWWRSMGQAVDNWSWDPRVWTPRFLGVLLTALALILGGSLYLLKTAPDAPQLTALILIFGLLCLLTVNLRDKRLSDPVLRSIFGLMGVGCGIAGVALQALPAMVALEQQYLPLITLNQVYALLLVLGAIVCLLRPAKRFAWVDQLQLGFLAGSCALLYYGFGSQ
ncbi:MAG: serine/threonine protein kinase, partial [Ktedonobacteraceae bacterium]